MHGVDLGPSLAFDFNDGFLLGMASGRYFCQNARIEIEGSWRNNTAMPPAAWGRVNNLATMLNVYRDFGNGNIKPYIGGGIGIALVKGEWSFGTAIYDVDDYAFAFQGIAGVSVEQSNNRDLFVEYRFYGNTPVDVTVNGNPAGEFTYLSHAMVFGIRFNR